MLLSARPSVSEHVPTGRRVSLLLPSSPVVVDKIKLFLWGTVASHTAKASSVGSEGEDISRTSTRSIEEGEASALITVEDSVQLYLVLS